MDHTTTTELPSLGASARRVGAVGRFGIVMPQLVVMVLLIRTFGIGESYGLVSLTPLILAGFVVHAWLPIRLRLPFFVFLSMSGALVVFGPRYGLVLLALGLGLILLCHLPLAFGWRVALVVSAGAGLAAMRAGWLPAPGATESVILPILGSMFMFRMVLYLYDLRHEKGDISVWQRLGYFFLLPNLVFPLFPVVDWQSFRRTYFDVEEYEIYQKGVLWMLRGTSHILLYRLIYHHLLPSPDEVVGLAGVVLYMVATYGLYLRISGQFHLIVGILCLFGFNLLETHHLYFLASSFTDYWRRINIYWKDFMTKAFYYPAMMRFRKWGMTTGIVLSTLVVFSSTWLLHSYQWFWLQGSFPITAPDALFWGILGSLVVADSIREMKKGRRRKTRAIGFSAGRAAVLSTRVLGMFVVITVLWSLWSSSSVGAWLQVVSKAGNSGVAAWVGLAGVLIVLLGVGVAIQFFQARGLRIDLLGSHPPFAKSAAYTGVMGVSLLALGTLGAQQRLGGPAGDLIASIRGERLNEADEAQMDRGYYEGLLEAPRYTSALWRTRSSQPADWIPIRETDFIAFTGDLLEYELRAGVRGTFKRAEFDTNQWGMRDREYARSKPDNTYRIALLGASYAMGAGVDNSDAFEALVEDRLNRDFQPPRYSAYEIVNLAVGGYSLIQNVLVVQEKALTFEPDVLLYTLHSNEISRTAIHLASVLASGIEIADPDLRALLSRAGVERGMGTDEIRARLRGQREALFRWAFDRIARVARTGGVVPAAVYVPTTGEGRRMLSPVAGRLLALARDAGFVTMNLGNVFAGQVESDVVLAPWDSHPNARGHQLLADALYDALLGQAEALGLRPTPQSSSGGP